MKYEIHVTSKDIFGIDMIHSIVDLAGKGAKIKDGTLPRLKFPYGAVLVLESNTPPTPSATVRVFDENNKEITTVDKMEVVGTENNFSMDTEKTYKTKDELADMDWNEFRKVVKEDFGITGRDRNLMTTQYLNKSNQR